MRLVTILLSSYATATTLINDESLLICPVILDLLENASTEPWSFVAQFPPPREVSSYQAA